VDRAGDVILEVTILGGDGEGGVVHNCPHASWWSIILSME
jgi:hypothetical protein